MRQQNKQSYNESSLYFLNLIIEKIGNIIIGKIILIIIKITKYKFDANSSFFSWEAKITSLSKYLFRLYIFGKIYFRRYHCLYNKE